VTLEISLPNGARFRAGARVAHVLSKKTARALGREPGIGFEFVHYEDSGDALTLYVNKLSQQVMATGVPEAGAQVLVAGASEPLMARLTNGPLGLNFHVFGVGSGKDAYRACLERPPDLVLADAELPDITGWDLASTLAAKANLSHIPLVLMSEDTSTMTRLRAYRLGLADFVPKPFTDEELCIRLSRVLAARKPRDHHTMRGQLADISIGTLLSLLEFERKSGILMLSSGVLSARLFVSDGQICKVDSPGLGTTREVVLEILDWQAGEFEFSVCEVVGENLLGVPTTQLLLEHAKASDERIAGDNGPDGAIGGELDIAFSEFDGTQPGHEPAQLPREYDRAPTRPMTAQEAEEEEDGMRVLFDSWPGDEPAPEVEHRGSTSVDVISSAKKQD